MVIYGLTKAKKEEKETGQKRMLKRVAFENFIHFKDRQCLHFENGPNYIIGENATGKSSIFELIRRCLSSSINTSISSLKECDKTGYVVSHYIVADAVSEQIGHIIESTFHCVFKPRDVFPCYVLQRYPDVDIIQKVVVIDGDGNHKHAVVVLLDENYHAKEKNLFKIGSLQKRVSFSFTGDSEKTEILSILNVILDTVGKESYEKELVQTIETTKKHCESSSTDDELDSLCELILNSLSECFVNTFSMRSLGPLQWNKSDIYTVKDRDKNFSSASEKAEIFQDLLEKKSVDNKEKRIFSTLTYPSKYTFFSTTDEVTGERRFQAWNENTKIKSEFLKVPKGVIEAKQISLILSNTSFQTICLEEPERGMHPQMIEKLRDLVMRNISEKTVIIISHHPCVINQWMIQRIFVCKRQHSKKGLLKYEVLKMNKEIANTFSNDDLKAILFSNTVLFVEDTADKIIISAIFEHILDSHPFCKSYLKENLVSVQRIVSNIQIIPMDRCISVSNTTQLQNNLQFLGMHAFGRKKFVKHHECLMSSFEDLREGNKENRENFKTRNKRILKAKWDIVRTLVEEDCVQEEGQAEIRSEVGVDLNVYLSYIKQQNDFLKDLSRTLPDELKMIFQDAIATLENFHRSKRSNLERLMDFLKLYILPHLSKKILSNEIVRFAQIRNISDLEEIETVKNIFIWESGSIEDVLCNALFANESNGLTMLKVICSEMSVKWKNPIRRRISQLTYSQAQNVSSEILNFKETTRFIDFLRNVAEKVL